MHWRHSAAIAILLGGFVAGTVDIGSASLINWRSPVFILHAVAGGLLGRVSFAEGTGSAALGLLLQWAMSLVIAAVFVAASRRLTVLSRRWALAGLSYGVGLFAVMNYVVVPLSAYASFPDFGPLKAAENLAAMLLFGLIVALFARSEPADPAPVT